MKSAYQSLIATIFFAAGCAPVHPSATATIDERVSPEFAALHYMIEQHASASPTERTYYSAYVVPKGPLGDAIVAALPHHLPPVSNSIEVRTGEALNAADGRRVKIWNATLTKSEEGYAEVSVSWFSASVAAGVYRVELERHNRKWVVARERLILIASVLVQQS